MTDLTNQDPPIQRLEVVTLRPGDLLAATVKEPLSDAAAARLYDRLLARVPAGVEVVIVSGQIELAAYRPLAEEA